MSVTGNFAQDFADWRDYSLTIRPFTGYDKYGGPTYGGSVTVMCYLQYTPTLVRNSLGQEVVSSAQAYIVGDITRNVLDKVTLPSGASSPPIRIDHFYNDVSVLELTVIYM
jgi:hypothetical protein